MPIRKLRVLTAKSFRPTALPSGFRSAAPAECGHSRLRAPLHPMHFHGQFFKAFARNGVSNPASPDRAFTEDFWVDTGTLYLLLRTRRSAARHRSRAGKRPRNRSRRRSARAPAVRGSTPEGRGSGGDADVSAGLRAEAIPLFPWSHGARSIPRRGRRRRFVDDARACSGFAHGRDLFDGG